MAIADEIAHLHHSVLELHGGPNGRGLRVLLRLPESTPNA
jgi:hypothetical protein